MTSHPGLNGNAPPPPTTLPPPFANPAIQNKFRELLLSKVREANKKKQEEPAEEDSNNNKNGEKSPVHSESEHEATTEESDDEQQEGPKPIQNRRRSKSEEPENSSSGCSSVDLEETLREAVPDSHSEDDEEVEPDSTNDFDERPRPRSGSISSASSTLSISSQASYPEEKALVEGYVLCLIAVTAVINSGKYNQNQTSLFKGLQVELTLTLKCHLSDSLEVDEVTDTVFCKMGKLIDTLKPELGVKICKKDCRAAFSLLDATDLEDCYDEKKLKVLRRGGYIQYFADIITICKQWN